MMNDENAPRVTAEGDARTEATSSPWRSASSLSSTAVAPVGGDR